MEPAVAHTYCENDAVRARHFLCYYVLPHLGDDGAAKYDCLLLALHKLLSAVGGAGVVQGRSSLYSV